MRGIVTPGSRMLTLGRTDSVTFLSVYSCLPSFEKENSRINKRRDVKTVQNCKNSPQEGLQMYF